MSKIKRTVRITVPTIKCGLCKLTIRPGITHRCTKTF